jgi:hypothetical protein
VKSQQGGSYGAYPPGAQTDQNQVPVAHRTDHTEQAPNYRQHQSLSEKQRANSWRRKADGLQRADLAQALLNSEFEEERG